MEDLAIAPSAKTSSSENSESTNPPNTSPHSTSTESQGQSPLAHEAVIEQNEQSEVERYVDIYSSFDDATLLKEYNRILGDPNSTTNIEALQRLSAMLNLLRKRNIDPELKNNVKAPVDSDVSVGMVILGGLTTLFIIYKLIRIFSA